MINNCCIGKTVVIFFNFESKVKSEFLNRSINLVGKNKSLNNLFKKFADIGLPV